MQSKNSIFCKITVTYILAAAAYVLLTAVLVSGNTAKGVMAQAAIGTVFAAVIMVCSLTKEKRTDIHAKCRAYLIFTFLYTYGAVIVPLALTDDFREVRIMGGFLAGTVVNALLIVIAEFKGNVVRAE